MQIKNVHLLRADGERSLALPRHALTTVSLHDVEYCLYQGTIYACVHF